MADLQISVDIDATGTRRGANEARGEVQNLAREAERAGRGMRNALNGIDFRAIGRQISEIGQRMQAAGVQMQSFGTTLTAAITLPLTALGTLGVKAALEVDAVRTKITALVGDSEKANRKIAELRELAGRSVGVTQAAALETFAQLKGIGDIADESINKVIGSLGKLNAAFKIEDQSGFLRNLVQLFSQGFEIPDLKEAIGRVPIFTQLLEQAFGTKDPEKLRQLKEAGKLTLDSFLTGLSDAINTDPRTANITENLTTKLAKSFERLNVALAPIGDVILSAVVPVIERLSPFLEQLGKQFAALSPAAKTAVVAFGAILAAIGPVLVVLGSAVVAIGGLVTAIGAMIGSAKIIAIVTAAIISLGIQLAPLAAGAALLYASWQTNFGGIRDLVDRSVAAILAAWETARTELVALTEDLTARIKQFWEQNGEDIMRALQTVSDFIRSIWTAVVAFWGENGETIKAITRAVWEIVKTIVKNGLEIILQTIRLVTAIINGDWAKAWDAIKQIVASTLVAIGTVIANSQAAIIAAVRLLIEAIAALGPWVSQIGISIGTALVQGIIWGIGKMAGPLGSAAATVVNGAISRMREAARIESPSKVTVEIGQYIGDGLIAGLESKAAGVAAATKKLTKEVLDRLKDIQVQFAVLSGLSPSGQQAIRDTDSLEKGISDIREIIKLRAELGQNLDQALPTTPGSAAAELKYLSDLKERQEAFNGTLRDLESLRERQKAADAKRIADGLRFEEQVRESGIRQIQDLEKEIELLGVTSATEKLRIEQKYEMLQVERDLKAAGLRQEDVDIILEVVSADQKRIAQLIKILELKNQGIEQQKKEVEAVKKAQQEAQKAYDQVFQTVQRHLDVLAEQGFGAFFKSVFGQFKQFLRDMVAEWLTSQFFKLFFKGGNNQTAQQNGQGGGILGGLLNGIFGGGATGIGPGGTPTYSGGGGTSGSGLGGAMGSRGLGALSGGGSGGGGIFGGLFGPRTNVLTGQTSRLGGIMGGIGAIASVAGSAIGGRFGGILSAAGTGASIGAMFGPWGAAIGAGIGALFGIFGGDPKRKRDKREKLPELNRGFTDAMQQLRDLIRDVRTLRVDPDSAISRAQELRTQIASGFGIQFESKKYRKQAQTLVRQRTAEADSLIEELRRVAEISRAAGERQRRIIPEFASGAYISPAFMRQLAAYRRQINGMIPGRFLGQDNVPAMLSPGEMVLNPAQQERTRRAAGFDVFRSAGIPGYSGGEQRGQGGQMPAITLVLEHNIDSEGMVRTTLKNSPAVQNQLQLTIEDLSANGRLTQRRRGV